jgi:protein-L-isoaspartate(D-aspartate) O-methyltransferase
MAWTSGCSGSTNEELIHNLHHAGFITRDDILHAMLSTDRKKYVPELNSTQCVSTTYKYGPYADAPQSIGSKVTISAPYIHAIELEVLADQIVKTGSRVLDIGSGSGILLAYMMRMAVSKSIIVGLEIVEDLVNLSRMNLTSDGFHVSSTLQYDDASSPSSDYHHHHQLIIRQGNGWHGAIDLGPFDAINVGAAASSVPLELIHQLRFNGTLLIPIGSQVQGTQILTKYIKRRKHITENDNNDGDDGIDNDLCMNGEDWILESIPLKSVRFVPLVQADTTTSAATTVAPDVNTSTAMATTIDWNRRYKKGWAYGKQPNEFLVYCVDNYCSYFHDDHLPSHHHHLLSYGHHYIIIHCMHYRWEKDRDVMQCT